ncbi:MAG: FAD-dependent oxidoreductase [Lentisphaeria bacterium]|nr:FAD-dependent oxidoreductase [Lentisphaeria bacterium]
MTVLNVDLCIYGGNASGIAAAYTAADMGLKVAVVEYTNHPGGMSAGGLGHTDQGDFNQLGGVASWFYQEIRKYYLENPLITRYPGQKGRRHEPHVAENLFRKMIEEKNITFVPAHRLNHLEMDGRKIKKAFFDYAPPGKFGVPAPEAAEKNALQICANYFMDASYEGDMLAQAGVSYTVGRESQDVYGESFAGYRVSSSWGIDACKVPGDRKSGTIPLLTDYNGKKSGEQDYNTQAYNFRMCLTDSENMVPIEPPANYKPETYEIFGRMLELWEKQNKPLLAGQLHEIYNPYKHPRLLKFSPLPNRKVDLNGSTDMVGSSRNFPEGSWAERSKIWQEHIDYTRGLLYFLRTDKRVRPETRAEIARWGLAGDEFKDTDHWPFQLYVREARRMKGMFVMTQKECQKNTVTESIGLGSYPLDSHACSWLAKDGEFHTEGNFWDINANEYYRIAMGSLLPLEKECENLTVPVCVSASHVAYASLRMEPIMMVMGEAAAVITALAAEKNSAVQAVEYSELRKALYKRDACLEGKDIKKKEKNEMKVVSIQPYRWTDEEIAAQQKKCNTLLENGTNYIAFCSSLEPTDNADPYLQVNRLTAQFKKIRKGIRKDAKVGFLIQSLLGHGWRQNVIDGYSEIITIEGKNNHRFCPLNQNFRNYVAEVVKKLCEAKPDFLIVDDDFRMLLSGIGCFCPDHLELFAEKLGRKYTREELQEILNKQDAESKKIGKLCADTIMESLWGLAKVIRQSIDSVNPELECGFCTSCEGEYLYAAKTAEYLAGNTKPFVRLNNGFYLEDGLLSFPYRQMNTAIQQHYIGEKVETISECDTFPHNRYSLSLTGLEMHITSNLLSGVSGMKVWIENFRVHDEKINKLYLDFFKKNWKKFKTLCGIREQYPYRGVVVPLPINAPIFFNPTGIAKIIRKSDFIADAFGVLGIAASYEDDGSSIVALTGEQLQDFSDKEIRELLKRKMILDIGGVRELLARNMGDAIGVKEVGEITSNVVEVVADEELRSMDIHKFMPMLRPGTGKIIPADGCRILTRLGKAPFANGPLNEYVDLGPGTVMFKNNLGGTIVSLPIPMTREVWSRNVNLHHPDRKEFFIGILNVLDAERTPVYVDTDLSCYLMYGFSDQHREFLAAVYNLSLDSMKKVNLKVKHEIRKISVLQSDGTWKDVDFKQKNGVVIINNSGLANIIIFKGTLK